MSVLAIISSLFKLFFLWFNTKTEKDAEKKKKKEGLLQEGKDAIENGDTSAITSVLDRVHRL